MYHCLMITDSLPTWAVDTVTEVDGEVGNDVQEEQGVDDTEHVNFIRIWGDGPQLSLVYILYTWEKNVKTEP